MTIYFKPTWLMIKQHNQTGLKYFCKTVKQDPYKYNGSGKRWLNHLNTHGNDVSTVWCQLFENKEELTQYALTFSTENNIVISDEWANLCFENGIDGGHRDNNHFATTWNKLPKTDDFKNKVSSALKGNKNKACPIMVGQLRFESLESAAKYFNRHGSTICYWIRKGKAIKL